MVITKVDSQGEGRPLRFFDLLAKHEEFLIVISEEWGKGGSSYKFCQ